MGWGGGEARGPRMDLPWVWGGGWDVGWGGEGGSAKRRVSPPARSSSCGAILFFSLNREVHWPLNWKKTSRSLCMLVLVLFLVIVQILTTCFGGWGGGRVRERWGGGRVTVLNFF